MSGPNPTPDAVGTYCEYRETRDPRSYATFADYAQSLNLVCPARRTSGLLQSTPTADTPDLVYYQVSILTGHIQLYHTCNFCICDTVVICVSNTCVIDDYIVIALSIYIYLL